MASKYNVSIIFCYFYFAIYLEDEKQLSLSDSFSCISTAAIRNNYRQRNTITIRRGKMLFVFLQAMGCFLGVGGITSILRQSLPVLLHHPAVVQCSPYYA